MLSFWCTLKSKLPQIYLKLENDDSEEGEKNHILIMTDNWKRQIYLKVSVNKYLQWEL